MAMSKKYYGISGKSICQYQEYSIVIVTTCFVDRKANPVLLMFVIKLMTSLYYVSRSRISKVK